MMADALRYMKVEPDKNQLDKDYRYGEIPVVEVPDLVGASVDDILEDLNMNFRLAKSGNGKYVISQAPKAGSRVDQGSTIRIFLIGYGPREVGSVRIKKRFTNKTCLAFLLA